MKPTPPAPRRSSASTSSSASPARRSGSTSPCSRRSAPRRSRRATRTSPTGGTRSSTSTTRSGVRFAHEVHPSEIAYDHWTTVRTLEAIDHRPAFGLNWDPSHMVWQDLDPAAFIWDFQDRIYHVDCKDVRKRARQRPQRPALVAPAVGRPATRLGLRLHRPRRRAVGGLLPHARRDRLRRARSRSSGRTPAWTASSGPPRPWASCAGSPSTAPTPPSTPPSAQETDDDRLHAHPRGPASPSACGPSAGRASTSSAAPCASPWTRRMPCTGSATSAPGASPSTTTTSCRSAAAPPSDRPG